MSFDFKDDVPQPDNNPVAPEQKKEEQEPQFKLSKRVPLIVFGISATDINRAVASNDIEKRAASLRNMTKGLFVTPKGYEVVPQRGQLLVLSLLKPSVNPKEQTVHSLVTESGLVLPPGSKIVRAFGFFPGNQVVKSISDLESDDRLQMLILDETDEEATTWFRKTSTQLSKLETVKYSNVEVMANGVYHFDDANGKRTYVAWGDTTLTESASEEAQTRRNTRYVWSRMHFETAGLKRLVCVGGGSHPGVADQLLFIEYKQFKSKEEVPASLDEQVALIRFDDGTKFKAAKAGCFGVYKDVNGRSQYIGTIANPNFELDELGNLTYSECMFDERKGKTCAADTAPVYQVTKFLSHHELRKRIR